MTFARVAELTGGRLVQGGDLATDSIVIDSREAKPGSLFFAIRGARLDGHDYVGHALETAAGAVVERLPDPLPSGKGFVEVDDTTRALQDLARAIRREYDFLLIAITGSAGKTTTKEMISALVSTEKRTSRSWGNFNNQIGFPLCLSNIPDGTEAFVSEMGMSSKGEIELLARMSHPDIGVYTNIQAVHLEFFDSIDGIAAAKRELLENLAPDGIVVVNADDARVMRISRDFPGRRVTYGVESPADYRAIDVVQEGLLGTSFTIDAEGERHPLRLKIPGRHNLDNLVAAVATARVAGISWDGIARGIEAIEPAPHRGVIVPWRGATLYDDTYNSNPYALARALELLSSASWKGRRIAVVGDMLELGPEETQFHYEAGKSAPRNIDAIVAVGPRSEAIVRGAREGGFADSQLHHFPDAGAALPFVRDFIHDGDLVLLKASRGIGLDRLIKGLQDEV